MSIVRTHIWTWSFNRLQSSFYLIYYYHNVFPFPSPSTFSRAKEVFPLRLITLSESLLICRTGKLINYLNGSGFAIKGSVKKPCDATARQLFDVVTLLHPCTTGSVCTKSLSPPPPTTLLELITLLLEMNF